MERIRVDDSRWPIVVVTWPGGTVTDAEFEDFLARSMVHWSRGRHGILHEASLATGPSARQRRRAADFVRHHTTILADVVAGTAIVVTSPWTRAVVRAINWLQPPPHPQRVFGDVSSAEVWLQQLLGIPDQSVVA